MLWIRISAVVPLLGLVSASLLLACPGALHEGSVSTRLGTSDQLAISIDLAVDYLSLRKLEYDELWFIHQGSLHLPDPFAAWARTLQPNGEPESAEVVLDALRDLEISEPALFPPPAEVHPEGRAPFTYGKKRSLNLILFLISLAGNCSPDKSATNLLLRKNIQMDMYGYILCHQAWALVVGLERGCIDAAEGEERRRAIAHQMLAELLASDGLDDLEVERMALLCLLGACHWIPEAHLQRLVDQQQASGSWGHLPAPGISAKLIRPEHTTALGFYTLARRWETMQLDVSAD